MTRSKTSIRVMLASFIAAVMAFSVATSAFATGDCTWLWQREIPQSHQEYKYKQNVPDTKTQYYFAKFVRTKTKSADVWQNFSPNKDQKHFEGPPAWPSDPRGTWQHVNKPIPPGHQGPDGVYQKGTGNGSWFYRAAGVWSDYGPWVKWSPESHVTLEDSTDPLGSPQFHGEGTYSDGTRWYRQWQARYDDSKKPVETPNGSHWVYYLPGGDPTTTNTDANWTTDTPGDPWVKFDQRTVADAPVVETLRSAEEPPRGDSGIPWTKVEGSKVCAEGPFEHQESVNEGSCTVLTPVVTGSISKSIPAIGSEVEGKEAQTEIENPPAGDFTFELPAVRPGESVKFRVVYQTAVDTEPVVSEWFTFTAGENCGGTEVDKPMGELFSQCEIIGGEKTGYTQVDVSLDNSESTVDNGFTLIETVDNGEPVDYKFDLAPGDSGVLTGYYSTDDGASVSLVLKSDSAVLDSITFETALCAGSTPPPPPVDETCPKGTKWFDRNGDGKVNKGECATPVKHNPPTKGSRPNEVSSGIADGFPFAPVGLAVMLAVGVYMIVRRSPGRHRAPIGG